MATYPLPTLSATVSPAGISIPTYNDIYQSLIAIFQNIYGSDIYVAPDSQDGQWIAILAKSIDDSNQTAAQVFQAMSPIYSQGAGLSSLVKLNGLTRKSATNSTAIGSVVGVFGSVINNGVVQDVSGNKWNLPTTVTIPITGTISVLVTAQNAGNIQAPIGTINKINNPQLGWQSFTNTTDAIPGAAVETDTELRSRQAVSTAGPATAIIEAIYAAVRNIAGVLRLAVYENPTGTTDANGIPPHSFAVIAEGGAIASIAAAIASRKPPGIQTYGTTTYNVSSTIGLVIPINFSFVVNTPVYFSLTVTRLSGYVAATGQQIINAIISKVATMDIGEDVYVSQIEAAASLVGTGLENTFYISAFTLGTAPAPVGTSNITIAYDHVAQTQSANIVLTEV